MAAEVHKLQQLEAGDKNPHIQQLQQQHNVLLEAHNKLVGAYNTAMESYGKAFQSLDARLGGLCLVLDDFVKGGVENITRLEQVRDESPSPGVHWGAYIKHYLTLVQEDLRRQAALAAEAGTVDPLFTPESQEQQADSSDTTVFGGEDNDDVEASSHGQTRATG